MLSAPSDPPPPVPPEVAAALWPLDRGGNWEGGTIDRNGQHWTHQPRQGWQAANPSPYTTSRGRVYTSDGVRRDRRREVLVRWAAGPVLALAGALVCAGLLDTAVGWAVAGLLLAAVVLGLAWAVGRP